jgi:mono/diheme cytochrome c family protein
VGAALYGGRIDLPGTRDPAVATMADAAPALLVRYGCAGCHTISGVPGARGQAGPPLEGFARRVYIAGSLTNGPDNLVRWLVNPRAIAPRSAMPVTGISEEEARIVADYLLHSQWRAMSSPRTRNAGSTP